MLHSGEWLTRSCAKANAHERKRATNRRFFGPGVTFTPPDGERSNVRLLREPLLCVRHGTGPVPCGILRIP